MKKILILFAFIGQLLYAQSPSYTSLVGKYDRDIVNGDGVDYPNKFPPCPLGNGANSEFIISGTTFKGYDEAQGYNGMGEVSYYFKSSSGQCPSGGKANLTKPIIVLDGFDPLDSRSGAKIYGKYLKYTSNINGVITDKFLGDKLRQQVNGFDVVILNFPQYKRDGSVTQTYTCPVSSSFICSLIGYTGGTRTVTTGPVETIDGGADYIERNAMVLVEFIQRTNQTLVANGSTEKITIIGPSMGGLISRYALAYMEKNNIPHNCKTWLSFDSPHLGANIAMGSQWWVDFYSSRDDNAKDVNDNQLGSKAARQLLLYHRLSYNETTPTSAIKDGIDFRGTFVNNMENNGLPGSYGFPTLPRKVCLINGAINGSLQKVINSEVEQSRTIQACEKAFSSKVNLSLGQRKLAAFVCFASGPFGFLGLTACQVAGEPTALSKTTVNFQPSYGNTCVVFDGYFLNSNNQKKAGSYANSVSLDIAPGGYYSTQAEIAKNGTGGTTDALYALNYIGKSKITFLDVIDNHCFIPTKSSLAYKWNNKSNLGDFGEDLSSKALVCNGDIPFDTYFALNRNQEHVSLNEESVTSKQGIIKINTVGLENGIYSLQIFKNGSLIETQQVVIVH